LHETRNWIFFFKKILGTKHSVNEKLQKSTIDASRKSKRIFLKAVTWLQIECIAQVVRDTF